MHSPENVLDGTETILDDIFDSMGLLAVEDFHRTFNNACIQIEGFEDMLLNLTAHSSGVIAPIANMSCMRH